MDKLDFLDGPEPADTPAAMPEPALEAAPVEQTASPAPESPSEGPVRGPDGKFAAKATQEPAPVQSAPAPTPEPPKVEPGHVPISALMDERDKRRALEEQIRQIQARQAPEPQLAPDPYEDPQGWQSYQKAIVADAQWQAVTSLSQVMANKEHGAELVQKAAEAWLAEVAQKPWLDAELRQQPHPYEYVVQRYQREQMLSQIAPDDLAQFQAWKAAQAQVQAQPIAAPQAASPKPVAPPPSIASAPSAGGVQHVPTGPGTAYGAIFG